MSLLKNDSKKKQTQNLCLQIKAAKWTLNFFHFLLTIFPFFCHADVVVVSSLMSKRKSKEEILLQSKTIK